jgi:hypothetical protein
MAAPESATLACWREIREAKYHLGVAVYGLTLIIMTWLVS